MTHETRETGTGTMTHETPEADDPATADPGLSALVTLLHFQGVGADAGQLRHRFGGAAVGVTEMLRCARELGLKARTVKTSWPRLAATPLPGDRRYARRRLPVAWQDRRRQGDHPGSDLRNRRIDLVSVVSAVRSHEFKEAKPLRI